MIRALKVFQTCTFHDAANEDEMCAKVNAFSKLCGISMNKAKAKRVKTGFFLHNEHELLAEHKLSKKCVIKCCCVE